MWSLLNRINAKRLFLSLTITFVFAMILGFFIVLRSIYGTGKLQDISFKVSEFNGNTQLFYNKVWDGNKLVTAGDLSQPLIDYKKNYDVLYNTILSHQQIRDDGEKHLGIIAESLNLLESSITALAGGQSDNQSVLTEMNTYLTRISQSSDALNQQINTSIVNHQTNFIRLIILNLVFNFILFIIICFLVGVRVIKPLSNLSKIISNHNSDAISAFDNIPELMPVSEKIRQYDQNLNQATDFVKKIGEGDLEHQYEGFEEDNGQNLLAMELVNMQKKMKEVAMLENQRRWANQGIADFADLMRSNDESVEEMGYVIISYLVKYLNSNQGGVFILEESEENEEQYLQLVACYAYERRKYLNKKVKIGEGLVGQAFLEQATIYLTEIPEGYVKIRSGLGNGNPTSLLIVPLKLNEEIYGVLELASFQPFQKFEIEFVEKLCESIAATISAVKVKEKTTNLLANSQEQAEELSAQQEEMRQNMEELKATQEQMERKQKELEISETKTKMILNNSMDAVFFMNAEGKIEDFNPPAKEMFGITQNEHEITHRLQDFIKKFDASKLAGYHNKKRRQKATRVDGQEFNVEMFLLETVIGGENKLISYIRDITQEVRKEQEIAENLMQMDELKMEIQSLKKAVQ